MNGINTTLHAPSVTAFTVVVLASAAAFMTHTSLWWDENRFGRFNGGEFLVACHLHHLIEHGPHEIISVMYAISF